MLVAVFGLCVDNLYVHAASIRLTVEALMGVSVFDRVCVQVWLPACVAVVLSFVCVLCESGLRYGAASYIIPITRIRVLVTAAFLARDLF